MPMHLSNKVKNVASKITGSSKSAPEAASSGPGNPDSTIPHILFTGTEMTKVSYKRQKKIKFSIDPDQGQIIYESYKHGVIPIESIKELRSGFDAQYYRVEFKFPKEAQSRWITIIYILQGAYKTLHMLADSRDVFHAWDNTLRKLIAIRQGLMNGLGNIEMRQAVWEKQYWKSADVQGDQKLEFGEVENLCKKLNVNMPLAELKRLFKEADTQHRDYLDFADFQRFVKLLKKRPEIDTLHQKLCGTGNFDFSVFKQFMLDSQKSKLSDEELRAIYEKYTSPAGATSVQPAPGPTKDQPSIMTIENFTTFLMSQDNAAFSEQNRPVWQDMTRPISEYFISSSHNTYLVGHQLVGVSTIEGYIRALLHSCRSVELDIYDGDDGAPVVYHGKTLTSKVSLRDICLAIMKYAFVTSPYPVIISAEVHCKVNQQDMMVQIMNEVFGDTLVSAPIEGRPKIQVLPSPEDLKGKILLKAKNLYVLAQLEEKVAPSSLSIVKQVVEADPSSSSSSESDILTEINELKDKWRKMRGKAPKPPKPKVPMSFALTSLLVYTVGVKCRGINSAEQYAPEHIFSLSESSANKLLKANSMDLVKHNETHVVRIYPKGTRINSTNYEPHRYWASGSQVVAINWQTFDLGYMINQAMFLRNGRSGYVLKPEALRGHDKDLISKYTRHFLDITIISAQQLPRPKDDKGREIIEKSVVDPLVEVSLHIPDWTHAPFLPDSAKAAGTKYSPPTDATTTTATSARTVTVRTGAVRDNGFNPVWQEEMCLPFDCMGNMMDLIFVEVVVRKEGKDDDDDEPLAVYCTPLSTLEPGFRHLPLHDTQLSQHLFSTLFVETNIRDVNT